MNRVKKLAWGIAWGVYIGLFWIAAEIIRGAIA